MRVLVAEDDRSAQMLLRVALQRLGHEVVLAADGQAALEVLQKEPLPLVISDWMMPRLSGIELCRAIRAEEARRLTVGRGQSYTYLILLTALDGKANYLEGMDAGADDLLVPHLLRGAAAASSGRAAAASQKSLVAGGDSSVWHGRIGTFLAGLLFRRRRRGW